MNHLKKAILAAVIISAGLLSCTNKTKDLPEIISRHHTQHFNMCGYAAPKLDVVRIGFIGLGHRGMGAVERMSVIEGVQIAGLSDLFPEKILKAQEVLEKAGMPKAIEYTGTPDEWKKMCENPDIDLIYICTDWKMHAPIALYAMEHGKHAASEVPVALTLEDCWRLVETSERTKKHCVILENCCYDFFELLTLNMARNGLFGDIVHGEGAYIHNLMSHNFRTDFYYDMWRLKENRKNGNLYPTHGLGPICQLMDINRGDKMEYLTSMSSDDFQMAAKANELAKTDTFFNQFANKKYRGNMNTSIIRTSKGRTIMVQHDVSSTRPYSRIHLISGTKGIGQKWPEPGKISFGHEWLNDSAMKALEEKYSPEIVKKIGELAKKVGGHGGMDFIMDWRLIDCLRNGLPVDMDVYDAALWSVITPLSEWSVANRSNSIDVPDFTCGAWKTNKPVCNTLEGGGTTGVKEVKAEGKKQLTVH